MQLAMHVLEASAVYFALVFAVGFVLGTIRTLWVVPRVGARKAELMEMPIMLVVIIMAARWTVLRLAIPPMLSARMKKLNYDRITTTIEREQRHESSGSRSYSADPPDHKGPPYWRIPTPHQEGSGIQALGQAAAETRTLTFRWPSNT